MSGAEILPSIIGIALVAAAAAFVLVPFARGAQTEVAPATVDTEGPDRFAIYQQVLELEFDQQLGKLSSEHFRALSAELLAEAGQSLRAEKGTLGAIDDDRAREIAAARTAFAASRSGRPAPEPAAARPVRRRAARTRS